MSPRGERDCQARVDALAASLAARGAGDCRLAIVCGSGLGGIAEELADATEIPWDEGEDPPAGAPGRRGARVPGHDLRFVLGRLAGVAVLLQSGRRHLYEGWSPFEVTLTVRAYARLGLGGVLLTNAAGALHPDWPPGTWMRITDHLNLQGRAPLWRGERALGRAYAPALGAALERAASRAGVPLVPGVYAGVLGPAYETPAEIRALARLGADAVGMSTVAEAAAACALGLQVAGLSLLTNAAAGLAPGPLDHRDVLVAGQRATARLALLLRQALPELAAALGRRGGPAAGRGPG